MSRAVHAHEGEANVIPAMNYVSRDFGDQVAEPDSIPDTRASSGKNTHTTSG